MNESELLELISTGESATVEFKSSLRYDLKTKAVNKDLTQVVAKTLAGFLNSDGGTLLIGVADNGGILGIEEDLATLSRNTTDYFELTLRTAIGKNLGVEISPEIHVEFIAIGEKRVALVRCPRHVEPVFFEEGEKREFYVRDGNSTRPLHIRASHNYIATRFSRAALVPRGDVSDIVIAVLDKLGPLAPTEKVPSAVTGDDVPLKLIEISEMARQIQLASVGVSKLVRQMTEVRQKSDLAPNATTNLPPWLQVATSRVIDIFLRQLAGAVGWKRIYLVSPWISDIDASATIQFASFLRRVRDDGATLYVVTRPPTDSWHSEAVSRLAETGRANIALVDDLHAKLYTALTSNGHFALVGSANFTQRSLENHEIGVLVNGFAEGKQVVSRLDREAASIYRTPGRTLAHKATFTI